jgi:hypothetical protein
MVALVAERRSPERGPEPRSLAQLREAAAATHHWLGVAVKVEHQWLCHLRDTPQPVSRTPQSLRNTYGEQRAREQYARSFAVLHRPAAAAEVAYLPRAQAGAGARQPPER